MAVINIKNFNLLPIAIHHRIRNKDDWKILESWCEDQWGPRGVSWDITNRNTILLADQNQADVFKITWT